MIHTQHITAYHSAAQRGTHLVDHAVQVGGGGLLGVHGDDVGARLDKVGDALLRLHNHLHRVGKNTQGRPFCSGTQAAGRGCAAAAPQSSAQVGKNTGVCMAYEQQQERGWRWSAECTLAPTCTHGPSHRNATATALISTGDLPRLLAPDPPLPLPIAQQESCSS